MAGRVGLRPLLATGALSSAAGFAWQATITPESGLLTGIVLPGVLITGGMGLASAPIAMAATAVVGPGEHRGDGAEHELSPSTAALH